MAPKDSDNGLGFGPAPTSGSAHLGGPDDPKDNVDRELFRNIEKLRGLRIEHRDLDDVISRLAMDMRVDEIPMKRLKKRKLMLKDQIERFESQLIPDLNA
jgi:hypothetical protein